MGLVSHKVLKRFDIDVEVSFAELNWDSLMKMAAKHAVLYSELPKFQAVETGFGFVGRSGGFFCRYRESGSGKRA